MSKTFLLLSSGVFFVFLSIVGLGIWLSFYGYFDTILLGAVILLGFAQIASFFAKGQKPSGNDVSLEVASEISELWNVVSHLDQRVGTLLEKIEKTDVQTNIGMQNLVSDLKNQVIVLQSAVTGLSDRTGEPLREKKTPLASPLGGTSVAPAPTLLKILVEKEKESVPIEGKAPHYDAPLPEIAAQAPSLALQESKENWREAFFTKNARVPSLPEKEKREKSSDQHATRSLRKAPLFWEPIIDLAQERVMAYQICMGPTKNFEENAFAQDSHDTEQEYLCFQAILRKITTENLGDIRVFCEISPASFVTKSAAQRLVDLFASSVALREHAVLMFSQATLASLSEEGISALAELADMGVVFGLSQADVTLQDWEALEQLRVRFVDVDTSVLLSKERKDLVISALTQARNRDIALLASRVETAQQARGIAALASYARGHCFLPPTLVFPQEEDAFRKSAVA